MRQAMGSGGGMFPKAGRAVKTLVVVHVVAYVTFLILLRLGVDFAAEELALVPRDFLTRGRLWQAATSVLIHAPNDVGHLLFNMLFLWWFGGPIEGWWGARGLYRAYIVSALGGVLLTVLAGLAVLPLGPESSLYHLWTGAHLGASGAVLGLTICWGAVLWDERMNFMLFGEMRVRTFVLVLIGIQVLTALSFDGTSSTSHFGGILAGYLLGRGTLDRWWRALRPARLKNRMTKLRVDRKLAERERTKGRFEVIDGGRDGEPGRDTAGRPFWGRKDDEDDPIVH